MKRTSKYLTRLLAILALAAVVVAVIVIVSSFKDEAKNSSGNGKAQTTKKHKAPHKSKAKTYTVQSGDTLTSIAHKTGVTVSELQALNPEIDPQILIAGEVLKLK